MSFQVPAEQRDAEPDWVDSIGALGCSNGGPPLSADRPAVAKIVLQTVVNRLPNWAACTGRAGSNRALRGRPRLPQPRKLALLPRFLFSINWASSGPGFSWPMAYYLTWVPGYDRFVVTGSSDSPEGNYGECDLALGYCSAADDEADTLTKAAEIISGDWSAQYAEWEQQQWECFLDAGLISYGRAHAMATAVWDPDVEDEYYPEDEDEDEDEDDELEPRGVMPP